MFKCPFLIFLSLSPMGFSLGLPAALLPCPPLPRHPEHLILPSVILGHVCTVLCWGFLPCMFPAVPRIREIPAVSLNWIIGLLWVSIPDGDAWICLFLSLLEPSGSYTEGNLILFWMEPMECQVGIIFLMGPTKCCKPEVCSSWT